MQRSMRALARNSHTRRVWTVIASCAVSGLAGLFGSSVAYAQGPQDQIPAFADPKFRDRVWEAGGPVFRDPKAGKMILSVTIEGEKTVSEHSILSHIESRQDRVYDSDQLNRDINELYRSGLFERIETRFIDAPEGIHIKLIVQEKPIVNSVVFHGNTKLDERDLVKHAGIEKGDAHSPQMVIQAKQRLIDLYQDRGFNHADIQVYKGAKVGETDVVFRISEGERERIWEIDIIGNQAFPTDLLKAKIKSRDSLYGARSYVMNEADPMKLDADKERLEGYYRSLGYFDAKVDYSTKYDEDGKWLYVTFVVSEGKQYFINEISIRGNQYFSVEQLSKGFKLEVGQAFSQSKMDHDTRLLREIYGSQGFYFCDVTPQPVYLPGEKLNLIYEIEEGDVYRVSDIRIHIDGDNSYTKHTVPMNLLGRIRPNRVLDSREVEAALRRLRFSNIFNDNPNNGELPQIRVNPVSDEMDETDLP
jgi:outer membrane protein insertion porin family